MKCVRFQFLLLLLVFTGAASAQQLLRLSGPDSVELFGHSLATLPNGNVVVGAVFFHPIADGAGSVYVFDPVNCNDIEGTCDQPLLRIESPLPTDKGFGLNIATTPSGDILIGSRGRAFVFDANQTGTTAEPERTLEVSELADGARVSAIAATSAGDIVVGTNSTKVLVFDGSNGELPTLTIDLPVVSGSDASVHSVAASGERIIVGRQSADGGDVFVFDGSGTGVINTPLLTIGVPTASSANAAFAESVAATPDGTIVVGSRLDDTGTVFLFDGNATGSTATPMLTLKNPDHFAADGFGNQVAATPSGHIIVGASVDLLSSEAKDAGSAYLFDPATCDSIVSSDPGWPESMAGDSICEVAEVVINNPAPGPRDLFGTSVASLPNGTIIVGAPQDETGTPNRGNVFLFTGPDVPDDGDNSACFSHLNVTEGDTNQISIGTSLINYMLCHDLIADRLIVDQLCVSECIDPRCHDDGCPYPFTSLTIDTLIQNRIDQVVKQSIDEPTFLMELRQSLAADKTRVTLQEPLKAPNRTFRWSFALALAAIALTVIALTALGFNRFRSRD